jgi:hypothetical protein
VVQRVEQSVALLDGDLELLPVGLGVGLRVIATDLDRDEALMISDRDRGTFFNDSHQYLRSIGW